MPRLIGRDGRLRIGLLLGAILATSSILALAAFFLFPRPAATPTASGTAAAAPSVEPTSSQVLDGSYDPAPTGCLGGQARDTGMVLTTQKKAGHSTFGAAEVAASIFRWGLRYPYPTAAEVRALRPALATQTASKQETELLRSYAGAYKAPLSQGVAAGTPYYVTTANGAWFASPGASADRVNVQIEAHPVIDGAYSTSTVNLQVGLQWQDGRWHMRNIAVADGGALANGATTFTSGC